MGVLFGTDGVRGVANRELTPELVFSLGRAGAYVLGQRYGRSVRIVIGKDPRVSSDMLEAALTAGICSTGAEAWQLGVIPTPAVAYLTRELGVTAGVVISASHNPVADNGVKFFGQNGYKLPDHMEAEIEYLVGDMEGSGLPRPIGSDVGRVVKVENAVERYAFHVKGTMRGNISGKKIVVDCAQGAAFEVAPRILRELGAEVIVLNACPDGTNINADCGSTKPQGLQEAVKSFGANLGLAFDGDADRLIAVDELGQVVDGDQILVACARHLKESGQLVPNKMVVTVMSNLGLHQAMAGAGIDVYQTPVGDRYVIMEMLQQGAVLGGEQSGHIIFLNHNTTGDGLITALQLLSVMAESGQPLSCLGGYMTRFPQVMVNLRVRDRDSLAKSPELEQFVKNAEASLCGEGRVLVRFSGTEPLLRIMAEGPDEFALRRIVEVMRREIENLEKNLLECSGENGSLAAKQ